VSRTPIVLDCDPGLDDVVAILTACKYADVVGITTVCGNSSLANTTRNALYVAELIGLDAPVHSGAAAPLVAPLVDGRQIHGTTGLGGNVPVVTREVDGDDAAAWLCDITRRRDDIHLVAVGPLTNVALAIRRDPGFAGRLAGLTIMGGAVARGNVTAVAEFNISADPEAAAVVFDSEVTVRMTPLDLTLQVLVNERHLGMLRQAATPTSILVAELLDFYSARQRAQGKESTGAVHDPVAVLTVTHPDLFELHEFRVDVELTGTHTRGMTVADRRERLPDRPNNAQIALGARADEVLALIIDAAIDPMPSVDRADS
jgi:inosine-uridine nucleoside N-ribohydrolase